jgi:hypothetical protein
LSCKPPANTAEDVALLVDQNWICPSKSPDAVDDLLNLLLCMSARVPFTWPEFANLHLGNLI